MTTDISAFRSAEPQPIDLMLPSRSVQPRAGMDEDTVLDYVAAMERGDVFPPLLVVETPSDFLLIDGWHRREAAQRLGINQLPARIVPGSEATAVELAAQCNSRHGLRRSKADLAKVVAMLTALPRWRQATDASLAAHCRVSRQALQRARSGGSEFGKAILLTSEQDAKPLKTLEADSGAPAAPEISPPRTIQRGDQRYEMRVSGFRKAHRPGYERRREEHAGMEDDSPAAPADIGAQHRRQREAAERGNLDRAKTLWGSLTAEQRREMTTGWFRAVTDSERRDMVIEGFGTILAEAERQRCAAAIAERAAPVKRGLVP